MKSLSTKLIFAKILTTIALGLSIWLCWQTANTSSIQGCGTGSSCSNVLNSPWSRFIHIPVSYLGLVMYLALLGCLILINSPKNTDPNRQRNITFITTTICFLILLGAVWFTLAQAFLIKSFCLFCCLTHISASLAAIFTLLALSSNHKQAQLKNSSKLAPILFASLTIASFAAIQSLFPTYPASYKQTTSASLIFKENPDFISFYNDALVIEKSKLPITVASKKERHLILLSDYTCPHCLQQHLDILKNKEKIAEHSNISFIPAYQNSSAKEINRLILMLGKTNEAVYLETLEAIAQENLALRLDDIKDFANKRLNNKVDYYYDMHLIWSEDLLTAGKLLMTLNLEKSQTAAFPQIMSNLSIIEGTTPIDHIVKLATQTSKESDLLEIKSTITSEHTKLIVKDHTEFLGRASRGDVIASSFSLFNPTDKIIEIDKWRTSCGCIKIPKTIESIGPNETIKIDFTFSTQKFSEKVTHKIFIFEKGVRQAIIIPATVDVWNPYRLTPNKLFFGKLAPDSASSIVTINFINTSNQLVNLELESNQNEALDLKFNEVIKGTHYTLEAKITHAPKGNFNTEVLIKTSDPHCPHIKIPVISFISQ